MPVAGDNKRQHPRLHVDPVAWIEWIDGNGAQRKVQARCLDVSAGGLGLKGPVKIAAGTVVTVGLPARNWRCRAEVRHCDRAESAYRIGVKFINEPTPEQWS